MRKDVTYQALVVKSPWAEQIASGEKREEYRTWPTSHRGPLLICVSKHPRVKNSGKAICIVEVTDCTERGPRDFAWQLGDVQVIEEPFPIEGRLKLFPIKMWIEED